MMVLRSTVRALRTAASATARGWIEWAYAIVPPIALALVLAATWQATQEHSARRELEARANQTSAP